MADLIAASAARQVRRALVSALLVAAPGCPVLAADPLEGLRLFAAAASEDAVLERGAPSTPATPRKPGTPPASRRASPRTSSSGSSSGLSALSVPRSLAPGQARVSGENGVQRIRDGVVQREIR